ncbi:MAG: hypothetical protein OJF47_002380 [Nitrospira sp.]|nr:MAG: hypothetical protein OJF47_002380 [Nitrospira sp.]
MTGYLPFHRWSMITGVVLTAALLPISLALAVPMHDDPNGFEGIPWGAAFSESDTFTKVEDADRVQTYELKSASPTLGPATVDSMRFNTIDGKFARVIVRYSGRETHDRILGFLQDRFGPLDRTLGQTAGGVVKFFDWQGPDSEIILRYDVRTGQGIIFFESQVFRVKFTESTTSSGF